MPAIPMNSTEIAEDIKARIAKRETGYEPGDKLPTYAELTELYKPVSVATIARVIRDLRMMGVVKGSPGRGTYVAERADQT